jgi:multidrug efflux pump subunit AcrA (membrane-fusion protein)
MVALMNTLAIYEQFREILGEERAKGFAETLGTMFEEAKNAATKEDLRSLRASVDAGASRLEAALTNLAEAQARTETRIEELAQAKARTETRVEELAQAQARTESRVDELAQAQARTESRVEELAGTMTSFSTILNQLVIRYDRHEGSLLELRFRDRLPAYLGRFLRKGRVIQASDLLDQIEPKLAEAAVDDFLRTDVVATGMVEGQSTYLVGEVSYTVDADDVMRAARRAACLVKAGLPTIPLVACEKISPQTTAYARQEGVRVWVDGSLLDV